ncbi:hypothetical protein Q0M83_14530, partial [Staphylococcus aureus]|nr:hypothetical protein [Staphylococcus aureus]
RRNRDDGQQGGGDERKRASNHGKSSSCTRKRAGASAVNCRVSVFPPSRQGHGFPLEEAMTDKMTPQAALDRLETLYSQSVANLRTAV